MRGEGKSNTKEVAPGVNLHWPRASGRTTRGILEALLRLLQDQGVGIHHHRESTKWEPPVPIDVAYVCYNTKLASQYATHALRVLDTLAPALHAKLTEDRIIQVEIDGIPRRLYFIGFSEFQRYGRGRSLAFVLDNGHTYGTMQNYMRRMGWL